MEVSRAKARLPFTTATPRSSSSGRSSRATAMLRAWPRRYDDGETLFTASDQSGAGPAGSKLRSFAKTHSYGAPTRSRAAKSGAIQASFS